MTVADHAGYALLWLSFAAGHSLLAGAAGRRLLTPLVGRWHRLAYNIIALLHLGAVLAIGRVAFAPDGGGFERPWPLIIVQTGALLLAVWLLWQAGRRYDLRRFAGLKVEHADTPPEPLLTEGIHARVRHPFYLAGYLALFALVSDPLSLATAVWGSTYLAIGTWIEERRLVHLYGEAYEHYRRGVPALVPRLSAALRR